MATDTKSVIPDLKPEQLLGSKRKVTRADLAELVKIAREFDAQFVRTAAFGAGDDPDDWCGTMWHRGPHIGKLVDGLVSRNWIIDIFPYGIPVIDGVLINLSNQARAGVR